MNEVCHSAHKEEKLKMNAEKVCCIYIVECLVAFKRKADLSIGHSLDGYLEYIFEQV